MPETRPVNIVELTVDLMVELNHVQDNLEQQEYRYATARLIKAQKIAATLQRVFLNPTEGKPDHAP